MKELVPVFVAIDPGVTGAIAVVSWGGKLLEVWDTPTLIKRSGKKKKRIHEEAAMVARLESIRDGYDVSQVAIENIHAMPGQGTVSMFSMGTGFGLWLGMLSALKFVVERVEPRIWKKAMSIPTGSEKEESRVRALKMFPYASESIKLKKHHGRADAILLAVYLQRKFAGKL